MPDADGALYLLGSHRDRSGIDWLDLHQQTITAGARGAAELVVTKVAKKRLRCSVGGAEHCDLDAGAGGYVGR